MDEHDEFIELMDVSALAEGTMVEVDSDGHALLVAKVGDALYVADARCPHMHAHLTKGTLDGTVLTCPLHHSQFDLVDGRVVRWTDWKGAVKSMGELIRHPRPLRVYETRVEGATLFIGPQKPPDHPAGVVG